MNLEPSPDKMPSSKVSGLSGQRDSAIGCALLSFFISTAVFLSHFPENRTDIETAKTAVTAHRKLVKDLQRVLQDNVYALDRTREALAQLKSKQN